MKTSSIIEKNEYSVAPAGPTIQTQTAVPAFESQRPEVVAQRHYRTLAAGSAINLQQKSRRDWVDDSSRMAAQRKQLGDWSGHPIQAEAGAGGLPRQLKAGIESLSGISMDHVRVHYNSSQPAQLNALAYAQGSEIHLAPGQERHLPHEAWHVVQQAQGGVKPTMQMKSGVVVNDDKVLETEADVMGQRAMQMQLAGPATYQDAWTQVHTSTGHGIRRQQMPMQMMTIRNPGGPASPSEVSAATRTKHVCPAAGQEHSAKSGYTDRTFVTAENLLTAAVDADNHNFADAKNAKSGVHLLVANVDIDLWTKVGGAMGEGNAVQHDIKSVATACEIGVRKTGADVLSIVHFKKS